MLVIEMVSTRRCLVWERLAWEQRWLHVVGKLALMVQLACMPACVKRK